MKKANNTITAVPGTLVGHWQNEAKTTGNSAILFPEGATFGATVIGAGASLRQVITPSQSALVKHIHGISFSGGSAFGLTTADGVMQVLEEMKVGFDTGFGRVPIVPGAIIFDLDAGSERPSIKSGYEAAKAATAHPVPSGRIGAGTGASVAEWLGIRLPGGLGSIAEEVDGYTVGALAVVNAAGSIYDPFTNDWAAGNPKEVKEPSEISDGDWLGTNTTLVAVATDAPMDNAQLEILSRMASAGMARTIYPAYTPFDGDVVFCCSTGRGENVLNDVLAKLGHVAATLVARAIVMAVK